ncbi:MAG: hypothetical protein JW955_07985 [Sedimentisphaerales bacterium]|nr:hypothetical protein [Sedimentisphaerales bacterium]
MRTRWMAVLLVVGPCAGCMTEAPGTGKQTFGSDVAFLQKHTDVVILKDRSGRSQVAVLPQMQGRVMTSTAEGPGGYSFGWINRELVASGKTVEHMNPFGGEDRFWIGPEGGQFSVFFKKGVPFDLEHWYTPAAIDTEPWDIVSKSSRSATLRKTMHLQNYSDTVFDVQVEREVRVLDREEALKTLGLSTGLEVDVVAYESNNRMTNAGTESWVKETGLLSIWILGMFTPSPQMTIVVPFVMGPPEQLGPAVNDAYFGKVPANRLVVRDGILFFSGDGQYRSKIGLSPMRAKNVLGSYDGANKALTVVQYNKPEGVTDYVNSMWQIQDAPFRGDTVNSYNDGPSAPGAKPMGPFCELETSSPAAALSPGQSILHTHRTFHFKGSEGDLNDISQKMLGVSIAEIKSALSSGV